MSTGLKIFNREDPVAVLNHINKFYAAHDPSRQFDEAFALYQSFVAGEREALELLNAIYATYPAALHNLRCQALWRYGSSAEYAAAVATPNSTEGAYRNFTGLMEHLIATYKVSAVDLLPDLALAKDMDERSDFSMKRLTVLLREAILAYDAAASGAKTPFAFQNESDIAALEKRMNEAAAQQQNAASDPAAGDDDGGVAPPDDVRTNPGSSTSGSPPVQTVQLLAPDPSSAENAKSREEQILKEVEQFLAANSAEAAKQRAVLWRLLWDAEVTAVESVDDRIAACGGNAVSVTRKWRESQRESSPRLESNLEPKKKKSNDDDASEGDSAAAVAAAEANNQGHSASGTAVPLPGSEARSGSASDKKSIEHLRGVLEKGTVALEQNEKRIRAKEQELAAKAERTPEDLARFAAIRDELNAREKDLQDVQQECQKMAGKLNERQLQLEAWEKTLTLREAELAARQTALVEKEEQHLAESQKRAEALQLSSAAVIRREQMVEVKEHVVQQREAEVRRKEESLIEKETATERRAEAIVQRSLELERHLADLELRSTRVQTRERAMWKSYLNQQLSAADPSTDIGASLGVVARDLKSVRGHLERLGTVASASGSGSGGGSSSAAPSPAK